MRAGRGTRTRRRYPPSLARRRTRCARHARNNVRRYLAARARHPLLAGPLRRHRRRHGPAVCVGITSAVPPAPPAHATARPTRAIPAPPAALSPRHRHHRPPSETPRRTRTTCEHAFADPAAPTAPPVTAAPSPVPAPPPPPPFAQRQSSVNVLSPPAPPRRCATPAPHANIQVVRVPGRPPTR